MSNEYSAPAVVFFELTGTGIVFSSLIVGPSAQAAFPTRSKKLVGRQPLPSIFWMALLTRIAHWTGLVTGWLLVSVLMVAGVATIKLRNTTPPRLPCHLSDGDGEVGRYQV